MGGTPYQELLQFFLYTAEMPGTATFLLVYGQFPVMQRIVAVQGCGSTLSSSWHEETWHQVKTPKQICMWINCERCQRCAMSFCSPTVRSCMESMSDGEANDRIGRRRLPHYSSNGAARGMQIQVGCDCFSKTCSFWWILRCFTIKGFC